jgi:predicted amidophosphoribosyltransferase
MDDVVTTGATLEAAYHALRTAWSGPLGFVTLLDAAR